MTLVSGQLVIDFNEEPDSDPFVHDDVSSVGVGIKVVGGHAHAVESGSTAINGIVADLGIADEVIRSKIEVGSSMDGDYLVATIADANGDGYALRLDLNEAILFYLSGYIIGTQIGANTTPTIAVGDIFTLEVNTQFNTITSFQNDTQLEQIIDATYTEGLMPGMQEFWLNSNNTRIASWGADGFSGPEASGIARSIKAMPIGSRKPTAGKSRSKKISN